MAPPSGTFRSDGGGGLDADGPRALGILLQLEFHLVSDLQPVEVEAAVQSGSMEEDLIPIFGFQEAKAPVGNQFGDGAFLHGRVPPQARPLAAAHLTVAKATNWSNATENARQREANPGVSLKLTLLHV